MVEDMQLRGLSEKTQEAYVCAVVQLAQHWGKSPDDIDGEELRRIDIIREYFLFLQNERQMSPNTVQVALYGIKFFFQHTLGQACPTLDLIRPKQEKKLPVVLSMEEVRRILEGVRRPRYRACLSTMVRLGSPQVYACGLRLSEGVQLQVGDLDSDRMMVHVRRGKGAKDRYVPLPVTTLGILRQYWRSHRHPTWLFPAPTKAGVPQSRATKPMAVSGPPYSAATPVLINSGNAPAQPDNSP
jgi:integrase